MLPAAQRLTELLDDLVLDEERKSLDRQGIAHIGNQLRGWDRNHEGKEIIFGRRDASDDRQRQGCASSTSDPSE